MHDAPGPPAPLGAPAHPPLPPTRAVPPPPPSPPQHHITAAPSAPAPRPCATFRTPSARAVLPPSTSPPSFSSTSLPCLSRSNPNSNSSPTSHSHSHSHSNLHTSDTQPAPCAASVPPPLTYLRCAASMHPPSPQTSASSPSTPSFSHPSSPFHPAGSPTSAAPAPPPPASKSGFPWEQLPIDIRLLVQSYLPLRDAFALAEAAPHAAQQHQLRARVRAIAALRAAWVDAAQPALRSYANPPHLRTRAARAALPPGDFAALTTLPLAASRLRSLSGVGELRELRVLDASRNALVDVDAALARCCHLRVLHLGWNALTSFPAVAMRLPQLRTLLLHHNRVERLPDRWWDRLPHLYRLGLFDCAIRGPLPEQLCRMLGTQTEQRRSRSANLQRNLMDHAMMSQTLEKFPNLAASIVF